MRNLIEDASKRPNIHRSGVFVFAKQNLRCPIPQRDHFVSVLLDGYVEGASQPKIGQLYSFFLLVDQNVLRFEIPMNNAIAVAEINCQQQLVYH